MKKQSTCETVRHCHHHWLCSKKKEKNQPVRRGRRKKTTLAAEQEKNNNKTSRLKIMVRSVVSGLLEVPTKKPPITIWYYIDFHSTVPSTTSTALPAFKKLCCVFSCNIFNCRPYTHFTNSPHITHSIAISASFSRQVYQFGKRNSLYRNYYDNWWDKYMFPPIAMLPTTLSSSK